MAIKQPEKETGQLIVIDLNQKKFEANGKTYHIRKSMSFERYRMYEKLQLEVGYGATFIQLYEHVKSIFELCNKMEFAQIAVKTHNILNGIKNVESRQIPALKLCTLFINADGEDESIINDDMIEEKIADWEAAKLDVFPFFQLAINSIPDFSLAFKIISQSSSMQKETGSQKKSQLTSKKN